MKIRTPSLAGSLAWSVYFSAMLVALWLVALAASWHLFAGLGALAGAVLILTLCGRWVSSKVGYVDAEFVIGLLLACALGLATMTFVGKLHRQASRQAAAVPSMEQPENARWRNGQAMA